MDIIENFVKTLDATTFIVVIIITIIVTFLGINYFKLCSCKHKNENLESVGTNQSSDCNCDEPIAAIKQAAQQNCAAQIAQLQPATQAATKPVAEPVIVPVVKQQNPKLANNNKYTLSFYYSDRCGYCKVFKPEWAKIKATVATTELNNVLAVQENECGTNPGECVQDADYIDGFPTVLLTKPNGQKIKYTDYPRTHDSVLNFLQQNM